MTYYDTYLQKLTRLIFRVKMQFQKLFCGTYGLAVMLTIQTQTTIKNIDKMEMVLQKVFNPMMVFNNLVDI